MAAPKKNKYWKFRDKHGRDHKYTPEKLLEEIVMYMEWLEANPLYEQKVFSYQGKIVTHEAPKMRAATIAGFCLFADICEKTFANYREDKDFIQVIKRIETIIYSQKFEGASADLLNANIIARDLGLKDKSDITSGDEPINKNTIVEFKNFSGIKEKKEKK